MIDINRIREIVREEALSLEKAVKENGNEMSDKEMLEKTVYLIMFGEILVRRIDKDNKKED